MKKPLLILHLFLFANIIVFSEPLYSPNWDFYLDPPEGYDFVGGDGRDKFSFENAEGAMFDIIIYHSGTGSAYKDVESLAEDIQKKLNNSGNMDIFEYRQKKAVIIELAFSVFGPMSGRALCMELSKNTPGNANGGEPPPLLLAMAYGPADRNDLMILHFSALDSIAIDESCKLVPGPITEYSYPGKTPIKAPVFGLGIEAEIFKEDPLAAQALIDREYQILNRYANTPIWKEVWIRFYRTIYRDSFERLVNIAFKAERRLNVPALENRDFADKALQWVQSFKYERDVMGSDFVNLVSAATEGRGDCDSRAMLWAIIMKQANISSAIMVSRNYGHAMGLADLPGSGARFELEGQKLLVAETTSEVSIGLIGETVSEISEWLGISFE